MGPETKKNLKQMEVYNFLAISIIGFFLSNRFKIMMECWKTDPLKRPDFECLRSRIHSMTRDEEQVRTEIFD